jgi:hypothetical protein
MRKMILLLIVVIFAVAGFLLLYTFPYVSSQMEVMLPYNPERYEIMRVDLINSVSRRGYMLCGEVTLNYGEFARTVFSKIFSGETMCLIFFNLPEPKGDYVIYQPSAELVIRPVRREDMDRIYAYSFGFGSPGKVSYEAMTDMPSGISKGVSRAASFYYELYKHGVRGRDIFVIFSYKPLDPESPDMPVNVTIIIDATVLRYGEKYVPVPMEPPPEPKSGREIEDIVRKVDGLFEGLGYPNCGEYYLDPGRHQINLTFVFDPYEGKACYIKLLTRDFDRYTIKIHGGRHFHRFEAPKAVEARKLWKEETPPFITHAYSAFIRAHPIYKRLDPLAIDEPFSKRILLAPGGGGLGDYGEIEEESPAFYIYFSYRIAPESEIDPRDFKVVYGITLDVEVREVG